jgi:hypothetical protein
VAIASRGRGREIDTNDWYPVGGGESGWIAPKPKNPEIVFAGSYGGNITRYGHRTGQMRNVVAWPQLARLAARPSFPCVTTTRARHDSGSSGSNGVDLRENAGVLTLQPGSLMVLFLATASAGCGPGGCARGFCE